MGVRYVPQSNQTASEPLSATALSELTALHTLKRRGSEQRCDFCRISISRLDAEFEIEAQLGRDCLKLHFHSRCYEAWKALLAPLLRPEP